ncbi:MAG: hypothetical protein AAGI06_14825 [Pseudomonadota bacterium]
MGNLKTGHLVEAGLWLLLALVLFIYSFEFNKPIEIYKFGASGWPRAIILLIVLAALGQLFWHWKRGEGGATSKLNAAADDSVEAPDDHSSLGWYMHTLVLVAIPFIYMRVPDFIGGMMGLPPDGLGTIKMLTAAPLLVLFAWMAYRNQVGGMLALPIFFAALLQDMGFYALAPMFAMGVMYLMGERRIKWMAGVAAGVFGILLLLFVKLLYVGLPTGNVRPFYDFGNWVVTVLQ